MAIVGSVWVFLPIPNHEKMSFTQYTHFEKIGRVDLIQGDNLVAIFNLDCEHCQEVAKKMGELHRKHENFPALYVLFFSEGNTRLQDFEAITSSSFPYNLIDVKSFFDFIGDAPPRIYYLSNGKVETYWDKDFGQEIQKHFGLD